MTDWDTLLATPRTISITDQHGEPVEVAVTPKVRERERRGQRCISIAVVALLADQIAALPSESQPFAGDRLRTVRVELRERPDSLYSVGAMRGIAAHRRDGRVRTTYDGSGLIPTDAVLDLGEQLWDHLLGGHRDR